MEIAYVSSNKIYLEIEKKQDDFLSKILAKLIQNPSKFIATMLVGNNLTLVVYGFLMGKQILIWFHNLGWHFYGTLEIVIQITVSTIIVLLTSEFLPKVFFQIHANTIIKALAIPAYIFYKLFYYVATFIIWISNFVLNKFFKTQNNQVHLSFTKDDLESYIAQQMDAVEDKENVDSEIQIFQNALEFSAVKTRDIMTPRTELVAIDLYAPVSELRQMFIETGYSKILIYQSTIDDIVGYVHSFELFKKPRTIKSILIPVEFIPETMYIKDALDNLTKKRKSVAVIIDEYGGTSGIITVEDIVEELFGEIEDEHDKEEIYVETQENETTFVLSTRLEVVYLNEKYQFEIPESDSYGTLGGFIVDFVKEIPQKNDKITIGNYQFEILEATNKKIEIVKMFCFDKN